MYNLYNFVILSDYLRKSYVRPWANIPDEHTHTQYSRDAHNLTDGIQLRNAYIPRYITDAVQDTNAAMSTFHMHLYYKYSF